MKYLTKKLKRKLVYKFGGIMTDDLPIELQREILIFYAKNSLDRDATKILYNGFSTEYTLKRNGKKSVLKI